MTLLICRDTDYGNYQNSWLYEVAMRQELETTIAFYDEQYAESTAHLDMQKLYDRFEKYLSEGASVLDAGCGSGRDSKHFIEKGYTVTAFDASGIMCEYASKLTGQEVRKLAFQEMDYQDCFDGIWAYAENEVVTPLVTQISWTNHLLIMSGCKSDEEREFYIRLCIKEKYSKRQLQRQMDSGYYERYMLSKDTLLPESVKRLGENPFLDSYVMEFLDLPNEYHENDLRKALIKNMKDFILELGKDFTFIDEEYKVQVGGDDFRIDLLFFHRGLQCLVAIELKIGKFKPEYVSKLDFYLEALDRQVKKENENPSVGLLLCATKNDEVVEYAMSRTMSPMLVSEYKLQLPDKKVLQKKLQELVNIPMIEGEEV